MDGFRLGYVMGLIVGEGCFAGRKSITGRYIGSPWLAMNLHARDPEPLRDLVWFLGGRIYGPYQSRDTPFLSYILRGLPLLEAVPLFEQYLPDSHKRRQFEDWLRRYQQLGQGREVPASPGPARDLGHGPLVLPVPTRPPGPRGRGRAVEPDPGLAARDLSGPEPLGRRPSS